MTKRERITAGRMEVVGLARYSLQHRCYFSRLTVGLSTKQSSDPTNEQRSVVESSMNKSRLHVMDVTIRVETTK